MAEKAEKKPQAAAPAAPAAQPKVADNASKGGLLSKTPVLLGAVMLLEAVLLGGGFWLFGHKPQSAAGAELAVDDKGEGHDGKGKSDKKTVEVPVLDFKALNRTNGHTFLYDVSIYVVTKADNESKIKDKFKDNKALIEDRVRTIIA